ncbi:SUMF1/EgtB/PvdO family nonheme iron enzyme [Bacteroidota bacterium]
MFTRLFYLVVLCSTLISNAQTPEIEWCNVPAGSYTWGENNEIGTIDYNYQIMKYEVTYRQFLEYLIEALAEGNFTVVNKSTVRGYYGGDVKWESGEYEFYDVADGRIHWDGNNFYLDSGYENYPVVEVSWFGSFAFAEHYGLRLPTEEEWEKAARGNDGRNYPWGNELPACSLANYLNCYGGTMPVGTASGTSPYGVFDMAGNVWEWTNSFWSSSSTNRVIRGGSWSYEAEYLQSWYRHYSYTYDTFSVIGLRCVKDSITVKNDEKQIIYHGYKLYHNYPNPFNPSTTITYSIPMWTFVKIKVFNILGNEIATLVNKEQLAGIYEIIWNAVSFPSGTYFYRIVTSGGFMQWRKLLLLK